MCIVSCVFFFKQKTAYEMRISDWSSDVCSSDLESHPRSFLKAMSWRVLGSIDTFLLSLFFTHSAKAAGAIASTEVVTKLLLYYVHERAWARVRWEIGRASCRERVCQYV